jgi:CRP-like cAMP-binding protein
VVTDVRLPQTLKASNIKVLKSITLFHGLDDSILEKISRMISFRDARRNEIIWLEQEPAKTIYFVSTGLVKLFKTSPCGKEQILKLVHPGDCFGHAGVFNGACHAENAQTILPSELYGITSSNLKLLLVDYHQLALNTIKTMATEIYQYISLVEDLSLRSVSGRLARMLLANNVEVTGDTSRVLTRADMAAMTGTVREVVSKSLRVLEDKGVIGYDRRKIFIRDKQALKDIMLPV